MFEQNSALADRAGEKVEILDPEPFIVQLSNATKI